MIWKVACAVCMDESFTEALNIIIPAVPTGGVPDKLPAGLKLSHDGNPVADQVYGGTPPCADRLALYGSVSVAAGRLDSVVITTGGGFTCRPRLTLALALLESVAVMLKV